MIREMKRGDVERVGAIWLAASLEAHSFVPADFWRADHGVMVEDILPKARGYVHLTEDLIDGFVTASGGWVHCLFVDPARQGNGIGRALLERVKGTAERLQLTVYEENQGARRFYEREGFHADGSSTCQHTGRTEIRMTWTRQDP